MKDEACTPDPGDFEVRILSDGRVCIVAADEEMFDLAEAIDPDNPDLIKRRKAKSSDKSGEARP